MSLILSDLIRWAEIHPGETKTSIATTTRTNGILWRIVEPYGIT